MAMFQCRRVLHLSFSENRIEQFGRFIKNTDESVKGIIERGQVHCEKCQGCKFLKPFAFLFKIGSAKLKLNFLF